MSRLNDMYQGMKKHTKKIVASAVIIGALAGIRGYAKNMGQEVYRGNIDGYSVIYEEGKCALFELDGGYKKNKMILKKGDINYVFEDKIFPTSIDWKNHERPNFKNDNLEEVIINIGNSPKKYFNRWSLVNQKNIINITTLEGQKAKEVFDKANPLYNNLRQKIREELQNKYEAEQKPFVNSFQK